MKLSFRLLIVLCFVAALWGGVHAGATTGRSDSVLVDMESRASSRLWLVVEASSLFRNAEFFMPFVKGYTEGDLWLCPTLCLETPGGFLLTGGVRNLMVAGGETLYKVRPVLQISYPITSWMTLDMGTLTKQVATGHGLSDPLMDRERWFFHPVEEGVQITTHWSNGRWLGLVGDTWVDWEHYLTPWTADQERFVMGSHQEPRLSFVADKLRLSLPLSFVGSHRGGQFSTLDTCIETLLNEQAGLSAAWRGAHSAYGIALSAYGYQNVSPEVHTAFTDGWAVYPQADFKLWHAVDSTLLGLMLTVGYWHAHHFQSARGSYLYQSVSSYDADYVQAERHMLTAALLLWHRKNASSAFTAHFDAEIYYDLDRRETDFVVGLQIDFLGRWQLASW